VKIEQSSNVFKEIKKMKKKLEYYENKLQKYEISESDKKENEIIILRAENSNLKKAIACNEKEILDLKNEISEFKKESHQILTNKKLIIQKLNSQINKYDKNLTASNSSSNTNTITNTNINTNLNTNNTNSILTTINHNMNFNGDFISAFSHRNQFSVLDKNKMKKEKNIFNKNQTIDVNNYLENTSKNNLNSVENTNGNMPTKENINKPNKKIVDRVLNLEIKNSKEINISNDYIKNSAKTAGSKNEIIKIDNENENIITNDFKQTNLFKKSKINKLKLKNNIIDKLARIEERKIHDKDVKTLN